MSKAGFGCIQGHQKVTSSVHLPCKTHICLIKANSSKHTAYTGFSACKEYQGDKLVLSAGRMA